MTRELFMLLGTIGAFCFALSGLPQAYKSWKDGHSDGVAHGTIILWLVGEGMMLAYALYFYTTDYVLTVNYTFNFLLVSVIFKYKYWRRKMEIKKKVTQTIEREVVEKTICNQCGEEIDPYDSCLRARMSGGYNSPIGDGVETYFDICEHCVLKMMQSFKIPATQNMSGYLGGDVVDEDGDLLLHPDEKLEKSTDNSEY